jgi:DNA processing protein
VVSGLAKGIDSFSHMGALNGKSHKTIAVLGNGLLIEDLYPKENRKLFEKILQNNGCIVSEYSVGVKAEKNNFPARNRIISGISDKLVVVEASLNSGSFITVDFSLDQGKDVFVVPGNIYSMQSMGCNKLIQEGANICLKFSDLDLK